MSTTAANSIWHKIQEVKTVAQHAAQLLDDLARTTASMYEKLAALMQQLPDSALSEQTEGSEPFRYMDLGPYLPPQPTALRPAYVRTADFSGFALLTIGHGIVVREERLQHGPWLFHHIEQLNGAALYEALNPSIPASPTPDHGGAT